MLRKQYRKRGLDRTL